MTAAAGDVAAIAAMSSRALKQAWEQVHDRPAPTITPTLLARDLAHQAQLAASGGMNRRLERRLRELADQRAGDGTPEATRPRLAGGSQLLREWGGQTHRVIVEPDGRFLYAGKHWRSL